MGASEFSDLVLAPPRPAEVSAEPLVQWALMCRSLEKRPCQLNKYCRLGYQQLANSWWHAPESPEATGDSKWLVRASLRCHGAISWQRRLFLGACASPSAHSFMSGGSGGQVM